MSFELAEQVADAVLYEGYVLYPYRASAAKNRFRWQFGVVAPKAYSDGGGGESWTMQTECLLEAGDSTTLDVRVRFLQLQARTVEEAPEIAGGRYRPVEALEVDGQELVTWEEGVERRVEEAAVPLASLLGGARVVPIEIAGGREMEAVRDARGNERARIVRERWPISAALRISAESLGNLVKLRVRLENLSAWPADEEPSRTIALRHSLAGAHTLLRVHGGAFVSLLEPPEWAAAAAAGCANQQTWPVLIGDRRARDVLLSSPIILYDYPAVAPESPGDLFDATEIDEMLTLRIMTLTDAEKREARATDERARRVVERADTLPPAELDRLHGAIRRPAAQAGGLELGALAAGLEVPRPEEAWVDVGSARVGKRSRVRLRPHRRADAMDMFLAGHTALVEGVYRTADDETYVAVTLDDDPAADLHSWYGRFFYFFPDEIEPLAGDAGNPLDQDRRE
jgi:hypothetical protein